MLHKDTLQLKRLFALRVIFTLLSAMKRENLQQIAYTMLLRYCLWIALSLLSAAIAIGSFLQVLLRIRYLSQILKIKMNFHSIIYLPKKPANLARYLHSDNISNNLLDPFKSNFKLLHLDGSKIDHSFIT